MNSNITNSYEAAVHNGNNTNEIIIYYTGDLIKAIIIGTAMLEIICGNALLIIATMILRPRHAAEMLVTSLAILDFINGCGPVMLSLIFYLVKYNIGVNMYDDRRFLCEIFSFLATTLRTSSCILTALMAIDRAVCVALPLYYRTRLQMSTVKTLILGLIAFSIILAALPNLGLANIDQHDSICLFAFNSNYALIISIIGYIQLTFVTVSYVIVVTKLLGFLQRQITIRISQQQHQPSHAGKTTLSPNVNSNNDRRRSSRIGVVREMRAIKETRTLTLLMATVVLVFCASWMPIVIAITRDWANNENESGSQLLSARMSLISSAINPLIYALLSRRYRKSYTAAMKIFCCVNLKKQKLQEQRKSSVSKVFSKTPQFSPKQASVIPKSTNGNYHKTMVNQEIRF